MPRYSAVLDACVLVPVALADTLLRIAEKGLYRPLWSERILTEARDAIEEVHPGIDVHKRFADMREAFQDALVTGWEGLEAGIWLPDEDDRHVVAAAIRGSAQAIAARAGPPGQAAGSPRGRWGPGLRRCQAAYLDHSSERLPRSSYPSGALVGHAQAPKVPVRRDLGRVSGCAIRRWPEKAARLSSPKSRKRRLPVTRDRPQAWTVEDAGLGASSAGCPILGARWERPYSWKCGQMRSA